MTDPSSRYPALGRGAAFMIRNLKQAVSTDLPWRWLWRAASVFGGVALTLGCAWFGSDVHSEMSPSSRAALFVRNQGIMDTGQAGSIAFWMRRDSFFLHYLDGTVIIGPDNEAQAIAWHDTEARRYLDAGVRLNIPRGPYHPAGEWLARPNECGRVSIVTVGFPFVCFRAVGIYGPSSTSSPGLRVVEGTADHIDPACMLPTHALWPGLLADIAAFTFFLLLPLELPLVAARLRRRRRRSRGLCVKCAYPLDRSMMRCPECGTTSAVTTRNAP